MAAIRNPQLQHLGHDPKARSARLRVSYEVVFSLLEREISRLHFKEIIQLCGTFSLDPEDFLFQLAEVRFATNGEDVVRRERLVTVDDSLLEEDGIPQRPDDLYAKLWVTPLFPSSDFEECSLFSVFP